MKTRSWIALALLFCLFGVLAMAADPTGTWKAQMPGRNGQTREVTFTLKAEGSTLTGSMGMGERQTQISEGKISGDDISFVVVRSFGGNEVKMQYKGKVSASEIKFTQQREGADQTREFTAKKS